MKRLKVISTILANAALVSILVFSGCRGKVGAEGPTGPQGPTGPKLIGTIRGFVTLIAETTIVTDRRGVIIGIDGTGKAASSDSTGAFHIDGVETGSWSVTVSRFGYSTTKFPGLQVAGNGDVYIYPRLFQQTSLTINPVSAVHSPGVIDFLGSVDHPAHAVKMIFYLDASSAVSSVHYSYILPAMILPDAVTGIFSAEIDKKTLNMLGFSSGSAAYAAVYGVDLSYQAELYSYTDPATGLAIIPGLNASPQFTSFIVP